MVISTGVLALLVYLPIFLFMLKNDFRTRFNKINSKTKLDFFAELLAGILYFCIIAVAFFHEIEVSFFFVFGAGLYMIGLILTYRGYYYFYVEKGLITKDVFSFSRNPTYFFGFVALFGVVLLTKSLTIFMLLILIMFLTHRIILNEEVYLAKEFGKKYLEYKSQVRRYI